MSNSIAVPNDVNTGHVDAVTGFSSTLATVATISAVQAVTGGETRYTVDDTSNFSKRASVVSAGNNDAANDGTFDVTRVDHANLYIYLNNPAGVVDAAPTGTITWTRVKRGMHVDTGATITTDGDMVVVSPEAGVTVQVDDTDVSADTYYYPAAAGQALGSYKDLSVEAVISGGVTLTVEASQDDDWLDVTPAGYDKLTDTSGGASFVDTNCKLDFDNLNEKLWRVKVVTSDATNAVKVTTRMQ